MNANKTWIQLGIIYSALFLFSHSQANAAVGTTAGKFAVNSTGAAIYTLPITVPPGIRGMQPKLSLEYSSQGGNGLPGVGWALGGLSAITRCNSTWAQDGSVAPVNFSASDKFCLDGNRLRNVSGNQYRLESEEFSVIFANGSGPSWFEVKTKDGLTYQYGNTTDSRILGAGSVPRIWALNRVTDRFGNYYTIEYDNDVTNGNYRPTQILYTGNQTVGTSPAYKVVFSYQTRTDDILTSYEVGQLVTESKRLNKIETFYYAPSIGYQLVRRYTLVYINNGVTQRSKISTITECDKNNDCLSPLTFQYKSSTAGWQFEQSSGPTIALMPYAMDMDFNGDGRDDIVYPTGAYWAISFASSSSGYYPSSNTTTADTNYAQALPMDFNSDGCTDILVPNSSGNWRILKSPCSSGQTYYFNVADTTSSATGAGGNAWVADYNGDGRPDVLYVSSNTIKALRNTGSGFSSPVTVYTLPGGYTFATSGMPSIAEEFSSEVRTADFNGDSATDLLIKVVSGGTTYWRALTSSNGNYSDSTNISDSLLSNGGLGDLNGDGLTDLIYICTSTSSSWCVRYGTGLGVSAQTTVGTASGSGDILLVDWDGDGLTDILRAVSGNWYYFRSLGTSIAGGANTGIQAVGSTNAPKVSDLDGNGFGDLVYNTATNSRRHRLHYGNGPDLLDTVTDGFGNAVTISYSPLASASYAKYSNSSYPSMDIATPLHVVSQFTMSDGIGSTYTKFYLYRGGKVDVQGRGFLGFSEISVTDSRDNTQERTAYSQAFPYIGMVIERDSLRFSGYSGGGFPLYDPVSTYDATLASYSYGAGLDVRYFPYVSQEIEKTFELATSGPGVQIDTRTITYGFDAYGNQTSSDQITQDAVSLESWRTQTANTFVNDETYWCLGRLTQTTITNTIPGGIAATRTKTLTNDPVTCRITQEIIEPNITGMTVTTTYGVDSFGNANSVSVTGSGMTTRTNTKNFGVAGVFPVSETNALSQSATRNWDYALGVLLSETDPNGISAFYQHDGFGRKIREDRPDGTYTTWVLSACTSSNGYCGDSLLRTSVTTDQYSNLSVLLRSDIQYSDALGRVKYEAKQTLGGGLAYVKHNYDALGRKTQTSAPYYQGVDPVWYTTVTYDLLGRPIQESRQISEANTGTQTTLYGYNRFTTTQTDPNGKITTKVVNAIDQLIDVTDTGGGHTTYGYDPFANQILITDPAGNQVTQAFNIRGFRTATSSPDHGSLSFTPNALGELVSQTDAKSQTTTFQYDLLGRMTQRTEAEGTTTWTWGTSTAAKNIGKIASVTAPGSYSETYSYDSLGRALEVTYNQDGSSYTVTNGYDSTTGLLITTAYPVSTSGYRFTAKYEYCSQILCRVKDNGSSSLYWEAVSTSARGEITHQRYGNSIDTISNYDRITGFLGSRTAGISAGTAVQNLSYAWDKIGNLTSRTDQNQASLTEYFYYDNLYRLDYSTLNGVTNLDLSYDAIGNITWKSDVGSYTYHATKKHAVVTAGSHSYSYDANGNMISRDGSTISWYSYNLPNKIDQGANYAQFWYGADRQRYKQVSVTSGVGTETTIYVGKLLEKVTKPSGIVEYKHYVSASDGPIAIVTRRSNGTNDTRYLHKDHLGSVDAITNESGGLVVRLSFDAFGKRRNAAGWSGAVPSGDMAQINALTHNGYTGHEGLDNVELIHMNGRVYDPIIGRFLSADPIIQDVTDSQSLNSYSYVRNNPLSLIDPSGYSWLSKQWRSVRRFFTKLWHSSLFRTVAGIAAAVYTGQVWAPFTNLAANAALGGAFGGAISGGDIKSAAIGGLTAGLFSGAGQATAGLELGTQALTHAAVGCVSATLSGGRCGQGALTAGFAKYAGGSLPDFGDTGNMLKHAAIGGVTSHATRGSFSDGSLLGGLGYAFNAMGVHLAKGRLAELALQSGLRELNRNLTVTYNRRWFSSWDSWIETDLFVNVGNSVSAVFELKPSTYQNGYHYNRARTQIHNYLSELTEAGGSVRAGTWDDLGLGTRQHMWVSGQGRFGGVYGHGNFVYGYDSRSSSSGLLFYEADIRFGYEAGTPAFVKFGAGP